MLSLTHKIKEPLIHITSTQKKKKKKIRHHKWENIILLAPTLIVVIKFLNSLTYYIMEERWRFFYRLCQVQPSHIAEYSAFGWIPSLVNQFITLQGILFYSTWCSDYFCVLNTVGTNHLFSIQQRCAIILGGCCTPVNRTNRHICFVFYLQFALKIKYCMSKTQNVVS